MKLTNKLKKTLTLGLFGLMVSSMLATPAFAKHGKHNKHERHYRDLARVIKVKPIYEHVLVRRNDKHCRLDHHDRGHGNKHTSKRRSHDISPIAGAVIGSAVGNQFGSGDGRKLATIAGAVIGTVIASEASDNHKHHSQKYWDNHYSAINNRNERNRHKKCSKRHGKKRYVKELVGYNVKYKYKGRIYKTRTRHHPGKYIHFSGGRNRH